MRRRYGALLVGCLFLGVLIFAGRALSRAEGYQLFGELVTRVDGAGPLVALTFDDGPTARHTPAVLAVLNDAGVTATFYINGLPASKDPATLAALVAAGHEIGNHGWQHDRMVLMSPGRVRQEITDTDAVIRAVGYDGPITFRPPHGAKLIVLPWVLSQMDRITVMWDVAPEDFAQLDVPPEVLAARTLERVRDGSIIILHPMFDSGAATRAALPLIIDGLRADGFTFVTVSDLLNRDQTPE